MSEEVMHQLFDPYGAENVQLFLAATQVEALISFHWYHDAMRACNALNGCCIWDNCCRLDIQYVCAQRMQTNSPQLDAKVEIAAPVPTTCSTLDQGINDSANHVGVLLQPGPQVFSVVQSPVEISLGTPQDQSIVLPGALVHELQKNAEGILSNSENMLMGSGKLLKIGNDILELNGKCKEAVGGMFPGTSEKKKDMLFLGIGKVFSYGAEVWQPWPPPNLLQILEIISGGHRIFDRGKLIKASSWPLHEATLGSVILDADLSCFYWVPYIILKGRVNWSNNCILGLRLEQGVLKNVLWTACAFVCGLGAISKQVESLLISMMMRHACSCFFSVAVTFQLAVLSVEVFFHNSNKFSTWWCQTLQKSGIVQLAYRCKREEEMYGYTCANCKIAVSITLLCCCQRKLSIPVSVSGKDLHIPGDILQLVTSKMYCSLLKIYGFRQKELVLSEYSSAVQKVNYCSEVVKRGPTDSRWMVLYAAGNISGQGLLILALFCWSLSTLDEATSNWKACIYQCCILPVQAVPEIQSWAYWKKCLSAEHHGELIEHQLPILEPLLFCYQAGDQQSNCNHIQFSSWPQQKTNFGQDAVLWRQYKGNEQLKKRLEGKPHFKRRGMSCTGLPNGPSGPRRPRRSGINYKRRMDRQGRHETKPELRLRLPSPVSTCTPNLPPLLLLFL